MKLKMAALVLALGGLAVFLLSRSSGPAPESTVAAHAQLAGQTPDDPALPSDRPAPVTEMHVYKTETCGCCSLWVEHMQAAGFKVTVENLSNADLMALKERHGIPLELTSCHTALAGGYVFEGHIPAPSVKSFLEDSPEVAGLAVPGMPLGSPGMEHPRPQPYDVIAFDGKGNRTVFARIDPR